MDVGPGWVRIGGLVVKVKSALANHVQIVFERGNVSFAHVDDEKPLGEDFGKGPVHGTFSFYGREVQRIDQVFGRELSARSEQVFAGVER